MDARKNFAYGSVATPPVPATTGLSLVLLAGQGADFPDPSVDGDYNVVAWPPNARPLVATAEIIRVTTRTGDTLGGFARQQESSTLRTILAGDQVMLAPTDKAWDDLEALIAAAAVALSAHEADTTNVHGITDTALLAEFPADQYARLSNLGPYTSRTSGEPGTIEWLGVAGDTFDSLAPGPLGGATFVVVIAASGTPELRYSDLVTPPASLPLATDCQFDGGDNGRQFAPSCSDSGGGRIAYPTTGLTVKVIDTAGTLLAETPALPPGAGYTWIDWSEVTTPVATPRIVACADNAGVFELHEIDAATGAVTVLVVTAATQPCPLGVFNDIGFGVHESALAWLEDGVLWWSEWDGTAPTLVPTALQGDTRSRPYWVNLSGVARIAYLHDDQQVIGRINPDGADATVMIRHSLGPFATGIQPPIFVFGSTVVAYQLTRPLPEISEVWIANVMIDPDQGIPVTPAPWTPAPLGGVRARRPVISAPGGPFLKLTVAGIYQGGSFLHHVAAMDI